MAEMLAFLAIVVAPVPLCLALLPSDRRSLGRSVLATLLIWSLLHLSIGLVLGVLGRFDLPAVLVFEGTLAVVGLLLLRFTRSPLRFPRATPDRIEGIPALALGLLGLTLLIRLAGTPITDYDSLAYHLPLMARWYQERAFVRLEQFQQTAIDGYPYGWEVLGTLFLVPFREDFLVATPNLVAWAILGLSVYLLSIEVGAGRTWALASTLLLLTMPMTRQHLTTMHVDLPLGAYFMASLYFATAHATTRSRADAVLFLAALGLVAGVKSSGLVYGSVLVAVFTALRARSPSGEARRETSLTSLLILTPLALLAGGFWYARNLFEVGNPLGHVHVTLGGITLLPGTIEPSWLRQTTLSYIFDPMSRQDWTIFLGALWKQLGLSFVLLVLSALMLVAPLPSDARRPSRGHLTLLLVLLLTTGAAYWTTPYSGGSRGSQIDPWIGQAIRYAFPFLGVLAVSGAMGSSRLPARKILVPLVVIAVVGSTMNATMAVAALILASCVLLAPIVVRRSVLSVGLWLILAGVFVAGTLWLRGERDVRRMRAYGGIPEFITENLGTDEALGYLLSHRSYLFYGQDFGVRVVYLPGGPSGLSEWVEELRRQNVGLIAVGPVRKEWQQRRELAWLEGPDGPFVRMFGTDPRRETVLYRLASATN